ncbi:ABC1 kinase family protein [Desulfohalovibrio reitneri]|uniref:ABC1 kinase family protein n=1 Tax=Desulfohalovibrio reitneri TaxID=1307759 RepID=UPI0004A6BDBC|nr:AarF/UbiB family protein [Desulfohalovibrio reitneri]
MIPSPGRFCKAFRVLLTVFCVVRRRGRFLLLRPQGPAELRRAILELGVSFMKLAQVLATRADFFTEEYLAELRTIHDEMEPMPAEDLRRQFARAYPDGSPFAVFDERPLASATIGQVHHAKLPDGTRLAVKIRRRGIERRVREDLRILRLALALFRPFFSRATRNSLEAVLLEFDAMLRRECDMARERDNLERFRRLYGGFTGVVLPRSYPELSSKAALAMSYEEGFRIDDRRAMASSGADFRVVLNTVIEFYTEQMLVKGDFHCDPHPGNILVRDDSTIVLLDFGMVKRLPESTRVAMIELVKAANERDFDQYVAACKRLGVVTRQAPDELVREFAERMFSIFENEALSASSMQELAWGVLEEMQDLPFKLPQEVVYVMRASSLVEGLGTTYIENFNGIKDVLPVLKGNLRRALGRSGLLPTLAGEARDLPLTVRRAKSVLQGLAEEELAVRLHGDTISELVHAFLDRLRPAALGLVLVAVGLAAALLDTAWAAWTLLALGAVRLWTALR